MDGSQRRSVSTGGCLASNDQRLGTIQRTIHLCVSVSVTCCSVCATGPSHWAEEYQTCAGKFQSPIDIEEHLVTQVRLPPMHFHGFQSEPISSTLTNNGHTGESSTMSLYGKENTEDYC
jgi:carbonic anhydrase